MTLKSLKIPLGFLAAGVLWALVSDPLIIILTNDNDTGIQNLLRVTNNIIFVIIVASFLYLGIKRQQKKLVASAEQYRRLFELNPNPMWVYDIETFRFVKVNEAALELYGYSMGEFLSMTIKDIRPPNDEDRLIDYVKLIRKGIRKAGMWQHFKKSGELMYVSIASHHMVFNKKPCSLVLINNITETVINEEKMKAQNTALQEIAWSNSHEVRHSLCSIISLTGILKDSNDEVEKRECLNLLQLCTAELDVVLKKMGKKVDALEKV